ncbi:MAG: MFS transporter [Candidatus Hodarchaeales archaeon]
MTGNNNVPIVNSNNMESEYNIKGYIFIWIGQLISLFGSSIVQFAIIWWITITTESEFMLAISFFLGFGPTVFLVPIAGVFVDRWSRKKIIATVDFLQALVTVFLIYLFMVGLETEVLILWVLVIITLRAIFQAFHNPAVEAIIPLLVPKDKLSRMNGLNYFFTGVIFLTGPVFGALLLEIWFIWEVMWIDAITFVFAVIPTILVAIPSVKAKTVPSEKPKFREEFSEGFVFIKNKKGLLALLAAFTAANFFINPLFVLLPMFIKYNHLGGATDLAFLMAIQQAGLIAGSLVMSSWKGFKNNADGVAIGLFVMYLGFLICSIAPMGNFLVLAFGMAIMGFTLPVANIASQTIWQKIVPLEKMGRVMSVRRSIAQSSGPISTILSGIIAELYGILPVFFLAISLGLFFLAYSWFMTGFRSVEKTAMAGEIIVEKNLTPAADMGSK